MSNTLSKIIMFVAGAAVGSAVTWKLVKTKYEQIAQEEIDAVREVYYSCKEENEETVVSGNISVVEEKNEETVEYEAIATKYVSEAPAEKPEKKDVKEEVKNNMDEPYVITPDEFDENGYDVVTLFYYADGVLATADGNEVIDNVNELVGEDSLTHFGEYEEDSVFVRNDIMETDFEILKDCRRFSEVE